MGLENKYCFNTEQHLSLDHFSLMLSVPPKIKDLALFSLYVL